MSSTKFEIDVDSGTARIVIREPSQNHKDLSISSNGTTLPGSDNETQISYDQRSVEGSERRDKSQNRRLASSRTHPHAQVHSNDYSYIDPESVDSRPFTVEDRLNVISRLSGEISEEQRPRTLEEVARTLSGISVFSIDPQTGKSLSYGPHASTRSGKEELSQFALDVVGSLRWRCQYSTSIQILCCLKTDFFEYDEYRHNTYNWLIEPSEMKLQTFEQLKAITEENIKTELQGKMDYAISVLTVDLKLWLGPKPHKCCCRENVHLMDGSVPRLSNDDDSLIRCRRQLQWLVYHSVLGCYQLPGSKALKQWKAPAFNLLKGELSSKTPTCEEIGKETDLLSHFPYWESLIANRADEATTIGDESAYSQITHEEAESGDEGDFVDLGSLSI